MKTLVNETNLKGKQSVKNLLNLFSPSDEGPWDTIPTRTEWYQKSSTLDPSERRPVQLPSLDLSQVLNDDYLVSINVGENEIGNLESM